MKTNRHRHWYSQRTLIAVAAAVCLFIAAYLLWFGDQPHSSVAGILVKVGLMLGVVALALPGIQSSDFRLSLFPLTVLLGMLVLVAARPRVFVLAAVIAALALGINGLLRRLIQRE